MTTLSPTKLGRDCRGGTLLIGMLGKVLLLIGLGLLFF